MHVEKDAHHGGGGRRGEAKLALGFRFQVRRTGQDRGRNGRSAFGSRGQGSLGEGGEKDGGRFAGVIRNAGRSIRNTRRGGGYGRGGLRETGGCGEAEDGQGREECGFREKKVRVAMAGVS
jgi:hypothetical protein